MDEFGSVKSLLMQEIRHPFEETGHRIADLRKGLSRKLRKRITQKDVADFVGVHEGTVTAWELGKQEPQDNNLPKLAEFLETSPDYIVGRPITTRRAVPTPPVAAREVSPNYDGLGIDLPGREALLPEPLRRFDQFMIELIGDGLGREDLQEIGRGVLGPIVGLNTLHKGREISDAKMESDQLQVLDNVIPVVLKRLREGTL